MNAFSMSDDNYLNIGEGEKPNDYIHDITFTHTEGIRPYLYAL